MAAYKQTLIPLPLGITTAYLVRRSRSVLIDSGNPGSAARILKQLAAHSVDPTEIALIVVTHAHTDHTGDLLMLKEKTGALIAAHRDEAADLKRGENNHLEPTGAAGRLFKIFTRSGRRGRGESVEPDVLVNQEMDLKPFGVRGKVIATPGHTPGSVSVILAGGEAVVGDLLMGGLLRRRVPRWPFFAHDRRRLERSIRLVLKQKPSLIYAAHGGPFKPEAVAGLLKRGEKKAGR